MSIKSDLLARFSGAGGDSPLFLPDLTLWYNWHRQQGTLPARWRDFSLPAVARAMGVPIWLPVRPWRVDTPGVHRTQEMSANERVVRYETPAGPLTARWSLGPDDDWWQTQHLVKSEADLSPAMHLAESLTYVLDTSAVAETRQEVGEDGILALELPRRAYSDLLHDYVGWGEGLLLLMGRGKEALMAIHQVLEEKLRAVVEQIAGLSAPVVLSPDNLDGQYITPRTFEQHLAPSYQRTAAILHRHEKRLVVHAGGPISRLLPLLAQAGVDGIEGIAGPPQGDASLAQARAIVGPDFALWGGIPQDLLIQPRSAAEFEAGVRQAVHEAQGDSRCLVGVADRVPATAELGRLTAIPELLIAQP